MRMCMNRSLADCRGRLPGECEEEVLDLVQEEPTYGSVYYNIQVCVALYTTIIIV